MGRLKLIVFVIIVAVLAGMFAGCAGQNSTPTPTPMPSPIPESTPTPTPTPTTSSPYAIIDEAFEARYKSDCATDIPVTVKNGYVQLLLDVPYEDFTIYVGDDGRIVLWCYGVKHTWIGKLVYASYTFDSDANDPLQFRVDREKGYVYVKGKGVVTEPDGKKVSLP